MVCSRYAMLEEIEQITCYWGLNILCVSTYHRDKPDVRNSNYDERTNHSD